jgi:hypothetical protein
MPWVLKYRFQPRTDLVLRARYFWLGPRRQVMITHNPGQADVFSTEQEARRARDRFGLGNPWTSVELAGELLEREAEQGDG